jgi:2,3-bisphosphoglycerate-dependent phosphoglycerate mutase
MAYLVLVRHGESEWNALGLWTGQRDVSLTEKGVQEAKEAAQHISDVELHKAYTSELKRAQQTLEEIKSELQNTDLETIKHRALNERDYGDYTAKNKWEIRDQIGEEEFQKLRRHWNHPVPNGETLKDVHDRIVPYFEEHIQKDLQNGKNVIIAAHGNSLRALMKKLDKISDGKAHELEIGTGEVVVYDMTDEGTVKSKHVRSGKSE